MQVVTYKNGKKWATDQQKTAGAGIRIVLSPESSVVRADGSDVVFIPVKIVDQDSMQVPTANQRIRFKVDGPAVIAAVGNGDPTNHYSFQSDQYEAFHGQCLLIIRSMEGKSGSINVTAESNGLASGVIRITAR